ncbi:hypothetical protein V8E53_013991 [Lactarius tabidus]
MRGITQLDPNVMLSHIRSLRPTFHNARIDLSSACNSANADAEYAWIATLSNVFEKRSSASFAPQSFLVGSALPPNERSWLKANLSISALFLGLLSALHSSFCLFPFSCSSTLSLLSSLLYLFILLLFLIYLFITIRDIWVVREVSRPALRNVEGGSFVERWSRPSSASSNLGKGKVNRN